MKNRLRKEIKQVIKSNPKAFVINQLSDFMKGDKIGLYLDINNEISVDNIINNLDANIYVPYMKDDGSHRIENAIFEFREYHIEDTCFDDFNIRSSNGKVIDVNELDIIVIPGLCFNEKGYRMGYGKACYDKILKNYHKTIIGVCYDNCFIKQDFQETHDVKVDYVFTEKRYIKIRG